VLGKQENRADEVGVRARASMHGPHVPLQLRPVLWRDAAVPGLELQDETVVDLEVDDTRAHHVVVHRLAHAGLPPDGDARCVQLVTEHVLVRFFAVRGAERLEGVDGEALAGRKDALGVKAARARTCKETRPRALAHACPRCGWHPQAILGAFGYYTLVFVQPCTALNRLGQPCTIMSSLTNEPGVSGSDKHTVHINLRECASLDPA